MRIPTLEGRLSVSIPEAALLLGLSRNSAYAAAERGDLPTIRLGRRILVPVGPLQALVAAASTPTSLSTGTSTSTSTSTDTDTDTAEGAGSGREGAA
ncbi:helix-turn-helix domain-containing protein [Nocardioides sp. AX2bis]|uniref:helix-turn-helix domain-containing protein n=1 Tax=Nocardioides sp. AX2bis TaxID=2653157 RepID=UPI00135C82A7|nr:helix-turn-helix domain-containing protein [Nocardioides sp. AX2bis]